MRKKHLFIVSFLAAVFLSCAGARMYISTPSVQTVENDYFQAVLEPIQKEGYDYFNAFRLTVKNKTVKPLGIDWRQSRYLFGGKPIGGFAFRNPSGQRINTPPTDTVPPAGAYLRDMVPVSLIGYQPLASSQKPGEETFSAGVIPAGENGIYLVVEQDGEKFSETLIVNIRLSEGKP